MADRARDIPNVGHGATTKRRRGHGPLVGNTRGQSTECGWDVIHDTVLGTSQSLARLRAFPVAFDVLESRLIVNYTLKLSLMKNMWMPSDEFLCNAGDHAVKIELTVLSAKLGVKYNLE